MLKNDTPTTGDWAAREKREARSAPSPRLTSDQKRRPADFWRGRHFCSFHHGSLLTKMRPVGLLSANSA